MFRDDAPAVFQDDGVRACEGHYDQDKNCDVGLKTA